MGMRLKPSTLFSRLCLILVTAISMSMPALAWSQKKDNKVAEVNGQVIARDEFEREMGTVLRQVAQRGEKINPGQLKNIEKSILDNMISMELIYQDSLKNKFKVKESHVNNNMMRIRNRFGTEENFKKALKNMGATEQEFRARLKRSLAIQGYISYLFDDTAKVTQEDTKQIYKKYPDRFIIPEMRNVRHILVSVKPNADKAAKKKAYKKIKKIRQKLLDGANFEKMAKDFSDGPSKNKGGDIGFIKPGMTVKPFEETAFKLKLGQLSEIVETRFGYHVIKITKVNPSKKKPLAAVSAIIIRHLKQEKVKKSMELYTQKLKKKAKIKTFLK